MNAKAACIVAVGLIVAALVLRLSSGGAAAADSAPAAAARPAAAAPVAAGRLVNVSAWKYPVGSSSNEGGTHTDGRVEIYDHFIILIRPDGERSLHPHGYYTNLRFKAE